MKTSFHRKLILFAALFTAITLGLFAWLTARHLHGEEIDSLDRDLSEQSEHVFRVLLADHQGKINLGDRHVVEDLFQRSKSNFFIEIVQGGTLVFRSANCRDKPLPVSIDAAGQSKGRFRGKDLRLGVFRQGNVEMRLGASLEDVEEVSDDLLISFAVTLPLALLALSFGAWWFSLYALKPVSRLASAAQQITAERLHERLPLPEGEDEIRHLAVVFNHMFDRLELSFQQSVRFTADASHELKTPLTIIRGELEAALRNGGLSAGQEAFSLGLLDEVKRLSSIVESLLLLSRADAGELQLRREPIDLSALLDDLREDAEVLGAPGGISVQSEIQPGLTIHVDARLVRQMLLNPLHNAIRYNEPGGSVRLAAQADERVCTVAFTNTGPGIAADQAPRVFDRFFRGDPARQGDGGHGLGLSIAREIARAHDGDLVLANSEPGCTKFVISLQAYDAE